MYRGVPPVVSPLLDIDERKKIYGYHEEHLAKSKAYINTSRPPEVPRLIIHERNRSKLREKQKAQDSSNLLYVRDLRKSNMKVRTLTYGGSQTAREPVIEPSWLQLLESCEKKVSYIPERRKPSTIEKKTYVENKDLFNDGNSKIHDDDGFSVIDEIPVLRTARSKRSSRQGNKSPPNAKQSSRSKTSTCKIKVTRKSSTSLSQNPPQTHANTYGHENQQSPKQTKKTKIDNSPKSSRKETSSEIKPFTSQQPKQENNIENQETKRINFENIQEQKSNPSSNEMFSLADAINKTIKKNHPQPQNNSIEEPKPQPQVKEQPKEDKNNKEESFNSGFSGSFSNENELNKEEMKIESDKNQDKVSSKQPSTFNSGFSSEKAENSTKNSTKSFDNFEDDFGDSKHESSHFSNKAQHSNNIPSQHSSKKVSSDDNFEDSFEKSDNVKLSLTDAVNSKLTEEKPPQLSLTGAFQNVMNQAATNERSVKDDSDNFDDFGSENDQIHKDTSLGDGFEDDEKKKDDNQIHVDDSLGDALENALNGSFSNEGFGEGTF